MGATKSRYNGWTHGRSPETVPKINPQNISCFHLLSFNSSVDPPPLKKKGCISALLRQQNVNQSLSFSPLHWESCQGCHPTLMSIFSSTSSPSLSPHSAWWISSLSDPLSPLSFSFSSLTPARSLSFMAYSCAATQALAEGWLVGGGDGWFARFQASWNIHVSVPASLCESAFTCTPPRSLCAYCMCVCSCL